MPPTARPSLRLTPRSPTLWRSEVHPMTEQEKAMAKANDAETRPTLYLAEYETPDALAHAAAKVRDAGYQKWDCHSPYPVHGLDSAMGLQPTKLGYISFIAGLTGLLGSILMIHWMNNVDYPLIIGGKPASMGSFAS